MRIYQLLNKDIDKKRYDLCMNSSPYATIYAQSWYLDIVAPKWRLLTTEDYSIVMPIPLKRKLGLLPYIIQPYICQQLGVFSKEPISQEVFEEFMENLSTPYCLLAFNPGNSFKFRNLYQKPNYILKINRPYEEIVKEYSTNNQTDLKKIAKYGLIYEKVEDFIPYLNALREHFIHYNEDMFTVLRALSVEAQSRNLLHGRIVFDKDNRTVLAAVGFFEYKNRFYYLAPVSTPDGKRSRAMRFLLDQFIRENAGKDMILDFEGSTIPSVAQFYEGFGSQFETYFRYYKNYVPIVAKIKI